MVSKKTERAIIRADNRTRWALPLSFALMAGVFLPLSPVSAAEAEGVEASTAEIIETLEDDAAEVEGEVNEDSLRYLLLVDSFETAERIPTKRLATPSEVVVITSYEIDANHYQSVEEALSHVNGMIRYFINGNDRVLRLIDGRRTFIDPPMKAIDRIEIVKGGGSALYGSDAVGGVINIITKKGDHDETTVDVNTGSWHRHTYEITNQGNDGKLGWFIDASIGKSRPYKYRGSTPSDTQDLYSDYDSNAVSLRLDHRFDDRNSLTFDVLHNSVKQGNYDYATSTFDVGNQVALTYSFKEGTSTPGFLRYFNNYQSDSDSNKMKSNSRLQGADYQNGWELGQHKLIVGAEWHQSADESGYIDFGDVKRKVNNQAYYLQDTITMGNKWTVVPGTRVDHNSQFGSQWSPKVAANYSPDESTKIYASWGRVYQAPNARSLYSHRWVSSNDDYGIPYALRAYVGDSNLKPEAGHTETIGIEHDFSDKVNASLSVFNAKIGNYLDTIDDVGYYENSLYPYYLYYASEMYVNSSADKQHGVDLNYRQKMDDHWSYNLGYAYIHRDRPLGSEEAIGHWRAPKNSYKASLRYQNGPWKASLLGMFGSGSSGSNYMEDDFALLDFNISCDVADWATVYAKAINFTNQNRSYYGRGFNAPGRLFQFGLDCRF